MKTKNIKMTKVWLVSFLGLMALSSKAFNPIQQSNKYQVYLNLNEVIEDKVKVEIVPPIVQQDSVEFHMARIIPGTYDVHNYGQFVSEFKAIDGNGETLRTRKIDLNRWMIYGAQDVYKLSYFIDDTYDGEKTGIFEPAGTSIEDNVFLLNNFGFIGYLDGFKDHNFELSIAKPEGFYGSTALIGELGDTLDRYLVEDFFTVHDNPIMYCKPDTATRMVGGAEVIVSVYSPNKKANAKACMLDIAEVLDAAADYLGGELPVEKYAVLIYCVPMDQAGNSYGALEHHTSTVLYMPEFEGEQFYSGVRDITSHEFFHIVTPLNIHSEQIADFDFINPEMSQHIWLYEGVTEYNSHLVQIKSNIYDTDEFLEIVRKKLQTADKFDQDVPLTLASKFTLTFLKDQYYDFYQKGAIAGMALDLKLLQLSEGKYGLIDLLMELGSTYGVDTFFKDDELFDIITEMTYPEMREFFALYFEGSAYFPLEELLENVGIVYQREYQYERVTLGRVSYGYNFETERLRVDDASELSEFGKDLGLKEGDELVEFNGMEVNISNISDVFSNFYDNVKEGDKLKLLIARPKGDDFKEVKLKAKAKVGTVTRTHSFELMEEASEKQLELRKIWINQ